MDESHFLREINAIPWEQPAGNEDYRNALLVFADWLEERGDPRSELIRLREGLLNNPTPEQRQQWEPRMQSLIHSGIQPVVATWENSIGMQFCWCPPGKFMMGSLGSEWGRYEFRALVTLIRGYWIGKYQVTQREWVQVKGTKPWNGQHHVKDGPNYPATFVNGNYATAFGEKLTKVERERGRLNGSWNYSLPSEVQWEYACRAGTITAYCFGDNTSHLSDYAWCDGFVGDGNVQREHPHEVGKLRCNAWGLYDMHGNIFEWCHESLGQDHQSGRDPEGESAASNFVYRGGSWNSPSPLCRSASRISFATSGRSNDIGFRLALDPSS